MRYCGCRKRFLFASPLSCFTDIDFCVGNHAKYLPVYLCVAMCMEFDGSTRCAIQLSPYLDVNYASDCVETEHAVEPQFTVMLRDQEHSTQPSVNDGHEQYGPLAEGSSALLSVNRSWSGYSLLSDLLTAAQAKSLKESEFFQNCTSRSAPGLQGLLRTSTCPVPCAHDERGYRPAYVGPRTACHIDGFARQ